MNVVCDGLVLSEPMHESTSPMGSAPESVQCRTVQRKVTAPGVSHYNSPVTSDSTLRA